MAKKLSSKAIEAIYNAAEEIFYTSQNQTERDFARREMMEVALRDFNYYRRMRATDSLAKSVR